MLNNNLRSRRYKKRSRSVKFVNINPVPMIDVILVLFIVFILTVPTMYNTVRVDLPSANQQPREISTDQQINIQVTREGKYLFEHSYVHLNDLRSILVQLRDNSQDMHIRIIGDALSPYNSIANLFSIASQEGFKNIELITHKR